ncbi:MAG: hypothetical protein OXU68_15075 [Bacteroidota bacterium]|nr:hypothetical protein [Bacteroidota bacterium]
MTVPCLAEVTQALGVQLAACTCQPSRLVNLNIFAEGVSGAEALQDGHPIKHASDRPLRDHLSATD